MFFKKKIKVLFVCMGNLCRSPAAHAVFAHAVAEARLGKRILVESAGTHVGRSGDPADARAVRAAARRGYDMSRLRTRAVRASDYQRFDYVLAMDEQNMALLANDCPEPHRHKLSMFMSYSAAGDPVSVPDPYYGAPQGFERVFDMAEDAAQGLLRHICGQHGL